MKNQIIEDAVRSTLKKNKYIGGYDGNNDEIDLNDYLDVSSEQKLQTAIDIINTKLRHPEDRYQVLKYFLNHINKSNMTSTMKMDLRQLVMK